MKGRASARSGTRAWGRWATGASAGLAVAAAMIMALAPASMGLTLVAPYSTSKSVSGGSSYSNCGASGGVNAKWVKTSGALTGAAKASMAACPSWNGEPQASSSKWIHVTVPFTVSTAGYYNASLNFKWTFTDAMSLFAASSCGTAVNYTSGYNDVYCYQESFWEAYLYTTIIDLTNGSSVSASYNDWFAENYSETSTYNSCYYGSCGAGTFAYTCTLAHVTYQAIGYDYEEGCWAPGTHSGATSLWSNSTSWNPTYSYGSNNSLLTTHKYALVVYANLYAGSNDYGENYGYTGSTYFYNYFNPPGASGSASVSAVPTTGGLTVTSITVTKVI